MAVFTLKEILEATSGELHHFDESAGSISDYCVDGVSTDTRKLTEGNLFIGLIGENFDGNTYAFQAAKDGAKALILSNLDHAPEDTPAILVPDTKIALENLATYYRKRQNFLTVAVTGSVGKTSTREMLGSAIGVCKRTYCTKNNENNEIGLSKTILETPEDTEVLVLEMGMRLRGEILELTNIAFPDIAVITNVGVAHIERLGTRDEILRAKLEILEGLAKNGLLILPAKDEYLQKAVREGMIRPDVKIAYFSTDDQDLPTGGIGLAYAGPVSFEDDKVNFTATVGYDEKQQTRLALSVLGQHHVGNALAALLCGVYLGLPLDKLTDGANQFAPIGHREKMVTVEGVHFIDDAYNAGPESMTSAIATLRRVSGTAKAYACMGDMLELGDVSAEKHFEVGCAAAREGLDGLFVIGDFKESVMEGVRSVDPSIPVVLCQDKKDIVDKLKDIVKPGDWALLKASHSFEMYTILDEYVSIFREVEC